MDPEFLKEINRNNHLLLCNLPVIVKEELGRILDGRRDVYSQVAQMLGFDPESIKRLKQQRSPTNTMLEVLSQSRPRYPLSYLLEILLKLNNLQALYLIQRHWQAILMNHPRRKQPMEQFDPGISEPKVQYRNMDRPPHQEERVRYVARGGTAVYNKVPVDVSMLLEPSVAPKPEQSQIRNVHAAHQQSQVEMGMKLNLIPKQSRDVTESKDMDVVASIKQEKEDDGYEAYQKYSANQMDHLADSPHIETMKRHQDFAAGSSPKYIKTSPSPKHLDIQLTVQQDRSSVHSNDESWRPSEHIYDKTMRIPHQNPIHQSIHPNSLIPANIQEQYISCNPNNQSSIRAVCDSIPYALTTSSIASDYHGPKEIVPTVPHVIQRYENEKAQMQKPPDINHDFDPNYEGPYDLRINKRNTETIEEPMDYSISSHNHEQLEPIDYTKKPSKETVDISKHEGKKDEIQSQNINYNPGSTQVLQHPLQHTHVAYPMNIANHLSVRQKAEEKNPNKTHFTKKKKVPTATLR